MIDLLIILIMFGAVTIFVIQPLFIDQMIHLIDKNAEKNSLEQRKKILYRQIKDLEMDHQMGNLSELEFTQQRSDLKKEVSQIITELKAH